MAGYSRYLLIKSIDDENLSRAKDIFSSYRDQGVIRGSSFEEDVWKLSDQRNRLHLRFDFSDLLFHENTRCWIACTADCYRQAVKAYVLFQMGALSLQSLRDIVNALRKLGEADFGQAVEIRKNTVHAVESLRLIPGHSTERDAVIEALEEAGNPINIKKNHRELADFKSYFRFHDELNKFWEAAHRDEKLFYFPLYLWWNLTVILPLRPTEFLLLPRDCLARKEGKDFITIRRTKLKGGNSKLTYSIEGDFERKQYPLSQALVEEIKWYQETTRQMKASPIGTLFCREACSYYKRWNKRAALDTAYGYLDLSNTLKIFYQEMLPGRTDISEIRLGDTRHIAMMNLIISGGSPVVCMELAGHEDIDISSNYYANMANLVECATYEIFRRNKKGAKAVIQGKRDYELTDTGTPVRVKAGWCYSEKRKEMKVDDCILSVNSFGEIGSCASCRYFRADIQGIHLDFYDTVKGKANVGADSWFLMHMIEAVRQGIGLKEDITTAMLRLQQSCIHYRDCLSVNYERGDR